MGIAGSNLPRLPISRRIPEYGSKRQAHSPHRASGLGGPPLSILLISFSGMTFPQHRGQRC